MHPLNNPTKLERFASFLEACGGQRMAPTNMWEVLRYKMPTGAVVVYRGKGGNVTRLSEEGVTAYEAFSIGKPYLNRYAQRTSGINTRLKHLVNTLLERDGSDCFYCGKEMAEDERSVEHLFARNQGGSDHVGNLVLSHVQCNADAGHLPVMKKVLLRESLQQVKTNTREFRFFRWKISFRRQDD